MTVGEVNHLTPQREAMSLFRHGTVKWNLTPNTVYQTAVQDIKSREYNIWLRGQRWGYSPASEQYKRLGRARKYGFLPKHINKAASAAALLKRALEDRNEGTHKAKNVNTLALYDNPVALSKAYTLAVAAEKDAA